MEYILIDPAMLMLQGEEEIMNNIDFFRNIIDLSNSKQISLCLYEEVLKNIFQSVFSDCIDNHSAVRRGRAVFPRALSFHRGGNRLLFPES